MKSRSLTRDGQQNERVARLRKCQPSDLLTAYNAELQNTSIAMFPTIDACRKIKSPLLGDVAAAFPEKQGEEAVSLTKSLAGVWLQAQLLAVSLFCGTKEKMTTWQTSALCEQIISQYPYLSLVEIVLFCARLRSQYYGKFYGTIDPARIIEALGRFVSEREADINRRHDMEEQEERERRYAEAKKRAITYEEYRRLMIEEGG